MFYAGSLYKGVCGIIYKGVEQFTVQGLELRIRSFRVLGKRFRGFTYIISCSSSFFTEQLSIAWLGSYNVKLLDPKLNYNGENRQAKSQYDA